MKVAQALAHCIPGIEMATGKIEQSLRPFPPD
jgi:hypothetical protein